MKDSKITIPDSEYYISKLDKDCGYLYTDFGAASCRILHIGCALFDGRGEKQCPKGIRLK